MPRFLGALPLLVLWGAPLLVGFFFALMPLAEAAAWRALFDHPQIWPSLGLSVFIGTASLLLATAAAFWIAAGLYGSWLWKHMSGAAGALLALPHLAFAIGFGFLIMPSGLIARSVSALVTGWETPPQWVTTQDPWGFALIASLALKEIPFIVWTIWTVMARGGAAQIFDGEIRSARSLGHGMGSIWLRVLAPQVLARIVWPLAIVWVYGATVVDMALAIGPTQPPPLALIVWNDLNNADAAVNARGGAGALFLALALCVIGIAGFLSLWSGEQSLRGVWARGPSLRGLPQAWPRLLLGAIALAYAAVLALLAVMSLSARWPFPDLAPDAITARYWMQALMDPSPFIASLGLALAAAAVSIAIAVLWFESLPEKFDRILIPAAVAAIAAPALLLAGGQYVALLRAGLTGTWLGLFLVHLSPAFAYAVIVLKGHYRAFDPRYRSVSLGLNSPAWRFWFAIKAPILRPALIGAATVAFAVSMAQYIPAQLVAAGRISTLPMEAVTLASGGNRALTAVFALALTLPPAIAFLLGAIYGRPRWG